MKQWFETFRRHYPLYLIEGWGLGTFMLSACLFTILLEHPAIGMHDYISSGFVRRIFIGLAMGLTAMGIIYSPWGRRSGAQLNPSVSLTMLFLKKNVATDAIFYMIFQTIGGTLAVCLLKLLIPEYLAHPSVNFAVTVPGREGALTAFACECIISFLLMFMTLITSNARFERLQKCTGVIAGVLIAIFVAFESPYSGMSMNPARTIASAFPAGVWKDCWIYFSGPPLSMLAAAYSYYSIFHKGRLHSVRHYLSRSNLKSEVSARS